MFLILAIAYVEEGTPWVNECLIYQFLHVHVKSLGLHLQRQNNALVIPKSRENTNASMQ